MITAGMGARVAYNTDIATCALRYVKENGRETRKKMGPCVFTVHLELPFSFESRYFLEGHEEGRTTRAQDNDVHCIGYGEGEEEELDFFSFLHYYFLHIILIPCF